MGVLIMRVLLFGVCIRAPDFGKLPFAGRAILPLTDRQESPETSPITHPLTDAYPRPRSNVLKGSAASFL